MICNCLLFQLLDNSEKFNLLLYDSLRNNDIHKYLLEVSSYLKRGNSYDFKRNYIYLVFHSRINSKNLDYNEILKECQKQEDILLSEQHKKDSIFKRQRYNLMLSNNKNCNVGKILNITLPVSNNSTGSFRPYPLSLDYSDVFDDSLQIKGKLIRKTYYKNPVEKDTIEILFTLRIIKRNNPNYLIDQKICNVGDTFRLPIGVYGRNLLNNSLH